VELVVVVVVELEVLVVMIVVELEVVVVIVVVLVVVDLVLELVLFVPGFVVVLGVVVLCVVACRGRSLFRNFVFFGQIQNVSFFREILFSALHMRRYFNTKLGSMPSNKGSTEEGGMRL